MSLLIGVALAALTASAPAAPETGQDRPDYTAPRAADGHPDLNGIWQALNEAHYDLGTHMARAAMAFREGPVLPVPADTGKGRIYSREGGRAHREARAAE